MPTIGVASGQQKTVAYLGINEGGNVFQNIVICTKQSSDGKK